MSDKEIIVPAYCDRIGAIGVALVARRKNIEIDILTLIKTLDKQQQSNSSKITLSKYPALFGFGKGDSENKHICVPKHQETIYLGIDIGSTSTNLALIGPDREVVDYSYVQTGGNPIDAVFCGMRKLNRLLDKNTKIAGAGVTGSGRYLVAEHYGVGTIVDEITAQSKAIMTIDSDVDTVFEIGGQDSKFVRIENGRVVDFKMNKVCAAGTGSFIEEQARKFDIAIENFGDIALSGKNPLDLGERCTVFIETSISSHLSQGAKLNDIASGLCYSIVNNYLHRVVGQKQLGKKIAFQGGVAFNQGVVNAFRAVTGQEIDVPPFFSVTGAFGAALLAMEAGPTDFSYKEVDEIQGGRKTAGNKCLVKHNTGKTAEFNDRMEQLVFDDYKATFDSEKKTVGIPRALFTFGMFPMFYAFLKYLGFNVLLSERSSDQTIRLAQEYALAEICYPVKLILGHIAELIDKRVDYIFFPDLFTVDHPGSHTRQNFGCAYMQLAFKIVNNMMKLESKGIQMLSPTIAFSLGKDFMRESFRSTGQQLGKTQNQVESALKAGMEAFFNFEKRMEKHGQEMMRALDPDKITFVIISKIYGIVDPVLNMGIPGKLQERGYTVLPFFDMPEMNISSEHPNMYWPFGQHILEPVKLIKKHPNLYAILLTHHSCGPDSVLQHYFAEMMGDKPYLNIEVDEHASDVGVTTRIEAFIESVKNKTTQNTISFEKSKQDSDDMSVNTLYSTNFWQTNHRIYLPYLFPYSHIFAEILKRRGAEVKLLAPTNSRSIALGRRHTQTNEYISLTALLGDVLAGLEKTTERENTSAFLLPQTEGAEVDGQYSRFVKMVLDRTGHKDVMIFSPFIEDMIRADESLSYEVFWGLLASDLLKNWPKNKTVDVLSDIVKIIHSGKFDILDLKELAFDLQEKLDKNKREKNILVVGEPLVVFNEYLCENVLKTIDENNHGVVYMPVSECMWLTWIDYLNQNNHSSGQQNRKFDTFRNWIEDLSAILGEHSPFVDKPGNLLPFADTKLGYYAGAFGRYRFSKANFIPERCDGILSMASTYENTEIAINVLQRSLSNPKPILNLAFDGNENKKNIKMLEAFLHYI